MIGFNHKFRRPISINIMAWIYELLGWNTTIIYVANPFGESYIRLECRRT